MQMSDAGLRRLAIGVFVASVLGLIASVLLDVASGQRGDVLFGVIVFTFPLVGVILLTRRPRNTLGWLMLSMGVAFAVPLESYANYALIAQEGTWPGGPLALALSGPIWVPFIGISGYLLLLFPDGHLPTRRWRWFAWTCGIGLGFLMLLIWTYPGTADDLGFPQITNPLGIQALAPYTGALLAFVAVAPVLVLGGAVAVIVRLRRTSDDVERHQLRFLVYAASFIATFYLLAFLPAVGNSAWDSVVQNIAALSFVLIPISIGIAVLRYRLYDIDVVIRKTVVFAVLALFISMVYAGLVIGVGAFVGTRSSAVLSAIAAAVVAVAFQPVARRARRVADRVVYGKRATPYEVLAEFGDQLSGTYSADDVLPRIARVLAEGIGADRARVWLVVGEDLREVASWPSDASPDLEDEHRTEVQHQGDVLGALSVAMPASDPMNPAKEKLVQDLAAHAGLVLRNVGLTEELRARLVDLQAAQKRLVAAQDEERRRLERNIHDGAQQQLVSLQVRQRLTEQLVDRDPAKAKEMLAQLQSDTGQALEDLRDLARGIYPPLLADKGLVAALQAQARKSPLPVTVQAEGLGRYPQEIEAAVYFSTLEALQNVAKYAEASQASVALAQRNGSLTFAVTDDGLGFDPGATGYGTGLQGIADRLGALEGSLEVASRPGEGTTIAGSVPGQEEEGT